MITREETCDSFCVHGVQDYCSRCDVVELIAQNKKLREALEIIGGFDCEDLYYDPCQCFSCVARAALKEGGE